MKLASISYRGSDSIAVAVDDDHLVNVKEAMVACFGADIETPADMTALLAQGDNGLARVEKAIQFIHENPSKATLIPQSEVEWHPPNRNEQFCQQ